MSLRPTTATISSRSLRADAWRRLFGSETIQIRSPIPVRAELPGLGEREVYLVDVKCLQADQIDRIAAEMSEKFGEPQAEVREGLIGGHGLPILAEDVSVAFDARLVADDEDDDEEADEDLVWSG